MSARKEGKAPQPDRSHPDVPCLGIEEKKSQRSVKGFGWVRGIGTTQTPRGLSGPRSGKRRHDAPKERGQLCPREGKPPWPGQSGLGSPHSGKQRCGAGPARPAISSSRQPGQETRGQSCPPSGSTSKRRTVTQPFSFCGPRPVPGRSGSWRPLASAGFLWHLQAGSRAAGRAFAAP
jgi:hypothetical protein